MVCSQLHFQTRLAPFILTEIVKTCTPSKYGTLIKRPWEFKGSIFRARRKAEKLSGQNLCALFFPTARKCKTERDSTLSCSLSRSLLFFMRLSSDVWLEENRERKWDMKIGKRKSPPFHALQDCFQGSLWRRLNPSLELAVHSLSRFAAQYFFWGKKHRIAHIYHLFLES